MKRNDGFTLIELLVTLVIVGVIMTFIISMMSSQYAIIRDVDAYLVLSAENKDVNDQILREFVKAEEILVDTDNLVVNSSEAAYFNSDLDLTTIHLNYIENEGESDEKTVSVDFEKSINQLSMKKTINSSETIIPLGDHLKDTEVPVVTFYRRLSQDRRVVSLVKVKIIYQHDGITKQYDLFYHLRNLQFN